MIKRLDLQIMRWDFCYKSFLSISFFLLVSCSNIETGNSLKASSTPQLPFNRAETILPSPDGKWTAYFFGLFQSIDYKLSVANFEDTIVWNINQKHFDGESWFIPYRWSQDSRYLYFNIHVSFSGFVPFYQGAGLQRLDVLDGTVSDVLSSGYISNPTYNIYRWNFVPFTLSTDDKQLAYINNFDNEIQLVIRDMMTGNEKSLRLKGYSDAGSIIWSPQQDKLVIAVSKGTDWSNALSSIELIYIDSLTTKTLIKDKDWIFDPIMWTNNHTVLLKERGGPYQYLDITTEKIIPAPDLITVPD